MADDQWEQRARKVLAKRARVPKHGRSLLTSIPAAERKRATEMERRAKLRSGQRQHRP